MWIRTGAIAALAAVAAWWDDAPNLQQADVRSAVSSEARATGLRILTGQANLTGSDPNAVTPGGVPLFKQGVLAGGLGVAGVPPNAAEYAAYTGGWTAGFLPSPPPNDKLPD